MGISMKDGECCSAEKEKNSCSAQSGKGDCGKGECGTGGCGMGGCGKKCGHILVAGIIYAVIAQISGFLVWGNLFENDIKATMSLWRAPDDPLMMYGLIIGNLVTGLAAACLFAKFAKGSCCDNPVKTGLCYGFKLWLILGIGQGVAWYGYSPVPVSLLWAVLIHQGIANILGGIIFAFVIKGKMGCGKGSCDSDKSECADKLKPVRIEPKPKE